MDKGEPVVFGPQRDRDEGTNMSVRGRPSGEQGQNLVEFAFVIPVFLLVILSIFEFGNIFLTQLQIQNAVRDGARYAALHGCPSDSQIQTQVQNATSNLNVAVSSSYSPSPCTACSGATNPNVTISGTYTYSAITPAGAFFSWFGGTFNSAIKLSSSSTMLNEC